MQNITRCNKQGHFSEGWVDACDECGSTDLEHAKLPDTPEDIGILRAEYNRRHAGDPGFIPSVAYDEDGKKMVN